MTLARELGFDAAPFHLDEEALAWVERVHAGLSVEEKVGQIQLTLAPNAATDDELIALAQSGVGGVYRFANGTPDFLHRSARLLRAHAAVPIVLAADLEFEEISAIGGAGTGTRFPNQLTVAATGERASAGRMATVAARQGGAFGFNWSFTPVADIALNFRNSLVTTRSFGDDAGRVAGLVGDYVRRMESLGMATATKHFPGDGVDERDQHTVPTRNDLDLDDWRASFGSVFAEAIAAGTRSIMVGHLSLPAYVRSRGGDTAEAYLPATFSRPLLEDLLRGELGFNGLIVSDASEMGGFTSLGRRGDLVGACIEAGCDVLLFNQPGDHALLLEAVASGALSERRLDVASLRVLAFKASLGLHRAIAPTSELPADERAEHDRWAQETAESAVTLVRDARGDLPLTPATHPRILLALPRDRRNVIRPLPDLEIADLLKDAGFDVELFEPDTVVDPARHSAIVYVLAEESKQGRIHLRVDWDRLQPGFPRYMDRHFQELPCILLSFGNPFHAYDAPQCPIMINAYSPVLPAQRAAIDAIRGIHPFRGVTPVDPFAGLDAGELIADQAIGARAAARAPQ